MVVLNLLEWFLLAGAGAAFPAVVLNVSRRMLPPIAIAGGMGFLVQQLTTPTGGVPGYLQVFLGAVMVGLLSEAFARRWRTPALTFLIPGIFPLVPGVSAYRTVQLLVAEQWQEAAAAGLTTAAASFAIAFGLMLVAAFFRGLPRRVPRTPPPSDGRVP